MSVLVVGLSHRTAPVSVLELAAIPRRRDLARPSTSCTAPRRSARSCCCRRATGSRCTPTPPGSTRPSPRSPRCSPGTPASRSPNCPTTSTSTSPRRPPSTCSRSPPGSTRWWSASRRSSDSCGRPTAPASKRGSVGSVLHDLAQTALRVGKRVHIPRPASTRPAPRSWLWPSTRPRPCSARWPGVAPSIVGAGSMGALSGATLRRRGLDDIVVANRTPERGERLAASLGGRAVDPRCVGRRDRGRRPAGLLHRLHRSGGRRGDGRAARDPAAGRARPRPAP